MANISLVLDSVDLPFGGRQSPVLVEFQAQKLRSASVVWLNHDWFADKGIDCRDHTARAMIEQSILERFAYCVPQSHDNASCFSHVHASFFADRYGGAGVGANGGSGRCAYRGRIQVKGIGQTPLLGRGGDYDHSHGCVTLHEAIRETIFAEVAKRCVPCGVIPIIAIVDTGTRMPWGERRALLLRPHFVRASALERASNYRPTSGGSEHLFDVERVRLVASLVTGEPNASRDEGVRISFLDDFTARVAQQMAFCHARKLYFGPFSTSNLSVNGELLDFGAGRYIQSWQRCLSVKGAPRFGLEDVSFFAHCCINVAYFVNKYTSTKHSEWRSEVGIRDLVFNQYVDALEAEFEALAASVASVARLDVSEIATRRINEFSVKQRYRFSVPGVDNVSDEAYEDYLGPEFEELMRRIRSLVARRSVGSDFTADSHRESLSDKDQAILPHEELTRHIYRDVVEWKDWEHRDTDRLEHLTSFIADKASSGQRAVC